MSAENVELIMRLQAALGSEDVVQGLDDPETERQLRATFAEVAVPDFECAMVGPDYLPQVAEATGADGFREVWLDWSSPFERLSIEIEDMIDAGDHVVSLVRQRAVTKTGGVEIDTPAAAVWTVRDGRLVRVEFHLDRDAALRAAGVEPQSSQP